MRAQASDPGWKKWLPSDQIPALWYDGEQFERLVAAHVRHDEDCNSGGRTVREFIAQFRGFSGSQKQKVVLEATRLARAPLSSLAYGDAIDRDTINSLHKNLKAITSPVKPRALGVIGKEHMRQCCINVGADPDSFAYAWRTIDGERPAMVEAGFAWLPDGAEQRFLVGGVNWSPGVTLPFQQLLGEFAGLYVGRNEPIVLVVHLAHPRPVVRDRGKASVHLEHALARTVADCVRIAARVWTKQRKREEREL